MVIIIIIHYVILCAASITDDHRRLLGECFVDLSQMQQHKPNCRFLRYQFFIICDEINKSLGLQCKITFISSTRHFVACRCCTGSLLRCLGWVIFIDNVSLHSQGVDGGAVRTLCAAHHSRLMTTNLMFLLSSAKSCEISLTRAEKLSID